MKRRSKYMDPEEYYVREFRRLTEDYFEAVRGLAKRAREDEVDQRSALILETLTARVHTMIEEEAVVATRLVDQRPADPVLDTSEGRLAECFRLGFSRFMLELEHFAANAERDGDEHSASMAVMMMRELPDLIVDIFAALVVAHEQDCDIDTSVNVKISGSPPN